MLKLKNFLNKNGVSFVERQRGGNGLYVDIPIYTEFRIELLENNTKLERCLKRRKDLFAEVSHFPGATVYIVADKMEREKTRDAEKMNMEKVNMFWQVYHESGITAAENFYRKNKVA